MLIAMKRSNVSAKLEVENKKMEDRLQVLKQIMSAEKARRELDGGIHWESGKPGPLRACNKHSSPSSISSHKLLVKATPNPKKLVRVKFLSDKNGAAEPRENLGLQCGQCDKGLATLTCMECIENYCQLCFAKIHQKGGLAKHHVKPILRKVKPVSSKSTAGVADATIGKASVAVNLTNPVLNTSERIQGEQNFLLDGTYDEAKSTQSFQDALMEWRSGDIPVSSKQCITYSSEGVSTEPTAQVSTTIGSMQAGEGSIPSGNTVIITFPDTNRVSYFEKLLIRRHNESKLKPEAKTLLCQRRLVETPEDKIEEMEEESNGISEYNIFYDNEDMEPANTNCNTVCTSLDDFSGIRPSTDSEVLIGEMSIVGDKVKSCEANVHSEKEVRPMRKPASRSKPKENNKPIQKLVVTKGRKLGNEVRAHSSKTRKPKDKQHMPHDATTTHQLSLSDLAASVESAWSSCSRGYSQNQRLTSFFLHSVQSTNETNPENLEKPLSRATASGLPLLRLGCTTWVPSSSIAEESGPSDKVEDTSRTPDQRPSTRDSYYGDTESDSESENERELFLSSRLSTVQESVKINRDSRATSSYQEQEEEEEEERDRADYDALEDLACELQASTVEFEGRLTAMSHREAQELDEEEEEEKMEGSLEGDDEGLDMTKVMSEFDIFQRELLEEDLDSV